MSLRIPLADRRLRGLDIEDMYRMRVGRKHWQTSFSKIPDGCAYREQLREYLDDIQQKIAGGYSLLFYGDYGRGKTGAAVLAMKEVVSRGGTALMIPAETIPTVVVERQVFDEEATLWERCHEVDLLVIDDLRREFVKDFGKSVIESLIRRRYDFELSMIITTNASKEELGKHYEAAMQALRERTQIVECDGYNWRANGTGA